MNRYGVHPALKSENQTVKDEVKIDDALPKREDSIPLEALQQTYEIKQDRKNYVQTQQENRGMEKFYRSLPNPLLDKNEAMLGDENSCSSVIERSERLTEQYGLNSDIVKNMSQINPPPKSLKGMAELETLLNFVEHPKPSTLKKLPIINP